MIDATKFINDSHSLLLLKDESAILARKLDLLKIDLVTTRSVKFDAIYQKVETTVAATESRLNRDPDLNNLKKRIIDCEYDLAMKENLVLHYTAIQKFHLIEK